MKKNILAIFAAVLLLMVIPSALAIEIRYDGVPNAGMTLSSVNYRGQTFQVNTTTFSSSVVYIKLNSTSFINGGNLTIIVQPNNATNLPNGVNLSVGSYIFQSGNHNATQSYYPIQMSNAVIFTSGSNYSFFLFSPNSTSNVLRSLTDPGNYNRGSLIVSSNAGTSWSSSASEDVPFLIQEEQAVTLISPPNGSLNASPTMLFNSSFPVVSNAVIRNATLFIWNSTGLFNSTINIIPGINQSTWLVSNFRIGNYMWNVRACTFNGTTHNCLFAPSNYSFLWAYTIDSETYNPVSYEGSLESFTINITVPSGVSLSSATLTYNNTNYAGLISQPSATTYSISRTLSTPLVDVSSIINFSWSLNFGGGSVFNTTTRTQTVNPLSNLIVSQSCTDRAYRFDFADEENLTALTNVSVQYNFGFGLASTVTPKASYGNLSNIGFFYVCINSTQSNNWTISNGEIFYTTQNYVDRRYYIFNGTVVTNATQNITLYDLLTASQTSFKLEALASGSLEPYVGKYTSLLRWYPELNTYKVVEMGLTDDTGSTVIHVEVEDVDYRVAVYERNGTLIKLANPVRMICLVNPCTFTVRIEPEDRDYTSLLGLSVDLDFDENTGMWTFTYSDSTQRTDTMNLTIYRDTGSSSFAICSTSSNAFTGVLSCNTSAYLALGGKQRAVITRTASPPVVVLVKIVDIITSAFKSEYGLWLSLLIAIPVICFLAFISPAAAVVGGVVALIPALYLGSVSTTIIGGFAVLGGIIMHFIKRIQ